MRSQGTVLALWYCPDNGKQITNLADQLASTEKDCRLGGNRRGGPSRCVAVRPRSSNVTARTGLTKRLFATFLQDQELWRKCGKTTPVKRKKGLRADALSPFASSCRRQDLNLHSHYRNQALNLARLPIPPLRLGLWYYQGSARGNQEALLQDFTPPTATTIGKFAYGSSMGATA